MMAVNELLKLEEYRVWFWREEVTWALDGEGGIKIKFRWIDFDRRMLKLCKDLVQLNG
jgi:hypothetical protein